MKRVLFNIVGIFLMLVTQAHRSADFDSGTNAFTEDDFELALEKSKTENKLLFIDFHAKWCTPCKWMEKTTLQDYRVKKILNDKYITVKVDIDDFDGFELKQKYDVQTLPTMIFLNSKGNMIERVNETLGTEKFLNMIKSQSEHVTPVVHPSNTSPFSAKEKIEVKPLIKKHLDTKTVIVANKKVNTPIKKSSKSSKSNKKHKKSYAYKSSKKESVNEIKEHLCLQMGVYSTLENANRKVNYLNEMSRQPIEISNEEYNGKIVYKVYLGEFHSLEAAKRYKYKLKRKHNIISIIK